MSGDFVAAKSWFERLEATGTLTWNTDATGGFNDGLVLFYTVLYGFFTVEYGLSIQKKYHLTTQPWNLPGKLPESSGI